MKQRIQDRLEAAIAQLKTEGKLPESFQPRVGVERARDAKMGDYASNIAMMSAKALKMRPSDIAELIVGAVQLDDLIADISIAGPGFINIKLSDHAYAGEIAHILKSGKHYGHVQSDSPKRVNLEFVSANPTGPLHVGHGRGAAYGSALSNVLAAAGMQVSREYYVNDAGRQMNILAVSVWLRYLEAQGQSLPAFPSNGYVGDYVKPIAQALTAQHRDVFVLPVETIFAGLPQDEADGGDKEQYIDALIAKAQALLGDELFEMIHTHATHSVLEGIKHDLHDFRIDMDCWFSEKSLTHSGRVAEAIQCLKDNGHTFEQDGALWFNAMHFGDEKDRVLVRADGRTTYFASDCAYLLDKNQRGYDQLVYIFGADHHGYVARLRAAGQALGVDTQKIIVKLVQFAVLYEGSDKISMSTRKGQFVTLRSLFEEVGVDAARYFYAARKAEQHMDFDLKLAKEQSNDNPVYYIQYAHARICSVMRQLQERGKVFDAAQGLARFALLNQPEEQALIKQLVWYPELINMAASAYEPHQVVYYLQECANTLHTYYNAHQFMVDDDALRNARLLLINAAQAVLRNGLTLLGVSHPDKM